MQTRQEKPWTDAVSESESARSAPVANGGTGDTGEDMSFSDTLYAKIEEVIGGDNPNQLLCLTIPGQALSASDYSYDYETGVKGRNVEARESKLANKQLDACRMTGGDSGLTLPNQYKSALNMLVPKLNGKVMEAKNDLRHLLMNTTAMLIARDISIRFHSATSLSDEFSSAVTQHASSGGGFLFFSGSHSSSQSSSQSGVHSKATDNSVTLRFDTPQIIGYYLECVHADESSYIDDVEKDKAAGYVTISEFASTYRKLLQEFQQTRQ